MAFWESLRGWGTDSNVTREGNTLLVVNGCYSDALFAHLMTHKELGHEGASSYTLCLTLPTHTNRHYHLRGFWNDCRDAGFKPASHQWLSRQKSRPCIPSSCSVPLSGALLSDDTDNLSCDSGYLYGFGIIVTTNYLR